MSRLGKFVVVVAMIYLICATVFFSHRTLISQLLSLPAFSCFLVAGVISIICIFREWRQRRWFSLLPFASCVLAVVISGAVSQRIRHVIFIQSLPSYEAIVQQMESGSIVVPTKLSPIPQAVPLAHLAYAVLAQKDTNGVLMVEFLTEGGFPVKHSGYLYVSSGVVESDSMEDSRWPFRHEERPRWFYISD
jgi:uncharacterized membrane protein YvlD (DUF360 family)